ncbi:MAG TPA: hypothetical protein DCR35_09005 [Runella sp.]|nr:hypothetical protein [Runella sp.]HAO49416.1 hypothetical protein [Runella sp.]
MYFLKNFILNLHRKKNVALGLAWLIIRLKYLEYSLKNAYNIKFFFLKYPFFIDVFWQIGTFTEFTSYLISWII